MDSLRGFLFVYILGGVTFLPLVLSLCFLFVYLTLPQASSLSQQQQQQPQQQEKQQQDSWDEKKTRTTNDPLRRPTDDQESLKSGTDALAEEFHRTHESDVAAGYYAVCREYVPGGVNGKPPERTTPAGEVVTAESPSVYQAMYRSLFDRKQAPSIEPSKGNAKGGKRARNVFYIVLRHGHLMLYDDANQVEVRYVISLAHHDVSICGGEGEIPEGEVWLKRNAICLSRKLESLGDLGGPTPPFFFFSENLSDKEDFYFALLQNQAKMWDAAENLPKVQPFEVKDIVTLVRRLHSSEEQLQTRWINAVLGRLFLALYKTPEMEEFVRAKITKKISRVNKPNFISKIALQKIDMGEGAPFITNPRLKDLTVDGNCCIETNVEYSGNFRVEISATVRIDLGPRFKAREVDIVLAVVLKKLEGHMLLRFKPPPSNRVWMSFETMPNMDMDIEPIVSSKQITYGIILRTIESRIREVVAESIVLPFWDDIPFLDTQSQPFRGGIWKRDIPKPGPDEEIPDESQQKTDNKGEPLNVLKSKDDRTMSMPALSESSPGSGSLKPRKGSKSSASGGGGAGSTHHSPNASSSSIERPSASPLPPGMRPRTFSNAADPVVTADNVKVDKSASDANAEDKKSSATDAMIEISNRSPPGSPDKSLGTSPIDAQGSLDALNPSRRGSTIESTDGTGELSSDSRPSSSHQTTNSSITSKMLDRNASTTSIGSNKSRRRGTFETFTKSMTMTPSTTNSDDKPQGTMSIGAATAAAKKWGMNMFGKGDQQQQQQQKQQQNAAEDPPRPAGTPEEPIGRGQPIPPLSPKKNTQSTRRKPVPSPPSQDQLRDDNRRANSRPSFPRRKPVSSSDESVNQPDELLVIEAPADSGPDSPIVGKPPSQELGLEQEQEQQSNKQNQTASDGDSHKTTTPDQQHPDTNNETNQHTTSTTTTATTPEPRPPTPHGMEILSATDGFFP